MTLDTIRIACANAESDLAAELAPHIPRAAEAKKTLANLLAAPGNIRVGKRTINVCLLPAGTGPEQRAFSALLGVVNGWRLTLPGDQRGRRLCFPDPPGTPCFMRRSGTKSGALAMPEFTGFIASLYVPERTCTIAPAVTVFAAFWIVRQGDADEPLLASLPLIAT